MKNLNFTILRNCPIQLIKSRPITATFINYYFFREIVLSEGFTTDISYTNNRIISGEKQKPFEMGPLLCSNTKQLDYLLSDYKNLFCFYNKRDSTKKQYSIAFSTAYHQALQGQVEARLQQSIIEVGNFWFTAWINAGAPSLNDLNTNAAIQDEEEKLLQEGSILEGIRGCGD